MTDSEIVDAVRKIYNTARDIADHSAAIRRDFYDLTAALEKVLSQRQPRGWKRIFK